jgi:hypothetical protein
MIFTTVILWTTAASCWLGWWFTRNFGPEWDYVMLGGAVATTTLAVVYSSLLAYIDRGYWK